MAPCKSCSRRTSAKRPNAAGRLLQEPPFDTDCAEYACRAWVTAENALGGPSGISYPERPRLWRVLGLNDPRLFRPILNEISPTACRFRGRIRRRPARA